MLLLHAGRLVWGRMSKCMSGPTRVFNDIIDRYGEFPGVSVFSSNFESSRAV